MLTPEYLWSVADPVVNIWEELNKWALKDICERIMEADLYEYHQLPGTARYRAWLLNQSGMHYEEMISVIAALTRKSEKEVKRLFEEAGLLTLENDKPIYENQGLSIPDIRTNSGLFQILNEVYQRTNGELKNYTRTTLRNSQKQFYDSLDRAYMAVATGTRSYSEVIKETVEDLAKEGTRVTYPSGHKDTIEVAVRRAVLTGVNQGAARISLENALQNGYEYVAIDAHVGARVDDKDKIANHAGWQGKIFKIIGSTEQYGNLEEETGFPNNPLGLCGYNCRHHFFPHILGDHNPFEQNIPDEEENRKAYELSQKQRYMERKIRETKRNLLGLETCIKNCPDEKTKFELQMEYDKKAAKLQKQNQAYREFCKENKLQTEDERLKPAKWDRTNADSARGAAKRYNSAKDTNADKSNQQRYCDVTEKWLKSATPNSYEVVDLYEYTNAGITYKVDGKYVVLDYSVHEKMIANVLKNELGGEIFMIPRVNYPQGISTPDYLFRGEKYDLKTPEGIGKNLIYGLVNKKQRQANNFIFDISLCNLDIKEINLQIENLYKSYHTRFVQKVIVIKDGKVIRILTKKR